MNLLKTKTMQVNITSPAHTVIQDTCLETVRSYIYLCQIMAIDANIDLEIARRTKLA